MLYDLFAATARAAPEQIAVVDAAGETTYGALEALVHRVGRVLHARGVSKGDRVGIWLEKSSRAVATMLAVLRAGAAYVPLDPQSPPARIAKIARDGALRLVVTEPKGSALLDDLSVVAWPEVEDESTEPLAAAVVSGGDLAYILYTSGSTGTPKGVCIDHRGARAFVDWAVATVGLAATDRLASHAPFHFDLSVFDLYGAFSVGATVCLIPETMAYLAPRLVAFVAEHRITIWYSVPSAIVLMLDKGGLEPGTLRTIVFAGEVYPLPELRHLRAKLPDVRLFNFYGPTETNVCTFHEVFEVTDPTPIGRAASGDEVWAQKDDGSRCSTGEEGELFVSGPSVMKGYWGEPPLAGPHATGDIVRLLSDGAFEFVGRRDRMKKVKGYRIELGDVEAALLEHDNVKEVAVVVRGEGSLAKLVAHVVAREEPPPSLLALKGHSAARLPRYMILDEVRVHPALPRTGNGKVDHALLS